VALANVVNEWKDVQGIDRYLQPPKDDYISNFGLREPLSILLLEAIDRKIIVHDMHIIFHAGRVDDGKDPAPSCYGGKQ
jgi:hypothetical protein